MKKIRVGTNPKHWKGKRIEEHKSKKSVYQKNLYITEQ